MKTVPNTDGGRPPLVFAVLALSLMATVTNLVPLSIIFVCLAPYGLYALSRSFSLPRSVIALTVLYGYFIANTLVYAPASLIDPEFYRRDGNVFVTFLPVIIGGATVLPVDIRQVVRVFVRWVTALNATFLAIFLATGGTIFVFENGVYHFLFEAHNAAGGYVATVTAFALGVCFGRRRPLLLPLSLVTLNFIALVLTNSRGSMLGVGAAVVIVLVLKERYNKTVVVAMAVVMTAVLAVAYPAWMAAGEPVSYATDSGLGNALESSEANVLDRVLFLWPRAFYLFLQSPLVGTGFGSYNDVPYHLVGIPHVLSFNRPSQLIFSAAHAHNTYLHVLAETGLLGFILLIVALYQIWKDMEYVRSTEVRLGLKLAFWTAVVASLTEHRLFTPSEMLPLTIIFGLALARQRSDALRGDSTEAIAGEVRCV